MQSRPRPSRLVRGGGSPIPLLCVMVDCRGQEHGSQVFGSSAMPVIRRLKRSRLPPKRAEAGQQSIIPCIDGEHANSCASSTGCNQGIVREPRPADLLVPMLLGDAGENSACACPVIEVWYEHAPGFIEIALKFLQLTTAMRPRPCVQFLKHDRTQPQGRLRGPAARKE